MTQFQDQTLICSNCGNQFVFSAGEQQFYLQKNLTPPQLCPICRSLLQAQKNFPQKPKK